MDKGEKDGNEETDLSKQIDPELIEAKIDITYKLFEKIIESSEEGRKLQLALPQFDEIKHNHFDQIEDEIVKFQSEIKQIHKEKVRYIEFCTKSLKDSELDAEQRSIQKIEGYLGFKKHQLRDLES